jgi:hypothetical protein
VLYAACQMLMNSAFKVLQASQLTSSACLSPEHDRRRLLEHHAAKGSGGAHFWHGQHGAAD